MRLSSDYYQANEGDWSLWLHREKWQESLWQVVLMLIEKQPPAKHPQTLQVRDPLEAGSNMFFLKVFHGNCGVAAIKDIFRDSKAFRSIRQATALAQHNFNVPITVAAGEKREYGLLRKAFVLTIGVEGQSLPAFLRQQGTGVPEISLLEKHKALKQLALEVRRLHELGFVHGDLVPTNIFVYRLPGKETGFFFMDNDRTRQYPKWIPHRLWRRNLVQLNRIPLPGVTLQDRMRFLGHYLGLKEWGKRERQLLAWLERKTRKRRSDCDSINSRVSFRQLMRWQGELK